MNYVLVSDLHTDLFSPPMVKWDHISPETQLLVVAGDTANTIGGTIKFLRRARKRFATIIFVDGNHEHYASAVQRRTIEETCQSIMRHMPEGCHYLGRFGARKIKVDGVWFVGTNGWYGMEWEGYKPPLEQWNGKDRSNDDRWIGFTAMGQALPDVQSVREAEFLHSVIEEIVGEEPDARIVVTTHTAPIPDTLSWPKHLLSSGYNAYYINPHMEKVAKAFSENIVTWNHGHVHVPNFKHRHGIDFFVNPRGYAAHIGHAADNPNWMPVEIEV